MSDLVALNRKIATHWLGPLDPAQESYVRNASVCLGRLAPSAASLSAALTRARQKNIDRERTARLNLRYLQFARLACKDALAGRYEILVSLGIDLEQASLLANLTDRDVTQLAYEFDTPLIDFAVPAFKSGVSLHARAAQHHAAALLAARPHR